MTILDTDQELLCFNCGIPIWPTEPKIVLGTPDGLWTVHLECAQHFIVDKSVDKSLGKSTEKT